MVEVTFKYEPEPEEVDTSDRTGLTVQAYDELMGKLMELGAADVKVATA